jgi:predicted ATPase/class 3 adenylate cyclase
LFTDIEGSTAMLQRLGHAYGGVLTDHHRLIRAALDAHEGKEVDTQGDAFFAVFTSPSQCVAAAVEIQRALSSHLWPEGEQVRVRMGIHSGEAAQSAVGLVGLDLHRGARIAAVAHGGQILLSAATAGMLAYSLAEGTSLRDLGLHRLKDLGRPERIFQLEADGLEKDFSPPRSLDNPDLANNLPSSLNTFVGRDAELAAIRALVEANRLVTLTGPGGSGKTRLALHVAADLLDGTAGGVWFVDLAPLADPSQVPAAVAAAFALREEAGRPYLEVLLDALRNEALLLVLDNCEHVIDATAELADRIGRSCPRVHVLATSREPLLIDGEHVYRVPPLHTPGDHAGLSSIRSSEAVRLFSDRAGGHGAPGKWDDETYKVIARVCRRLDGIPLAIELAAARLGSMSPVELEARLDQRFSLLTGGSRAARKRQQTLLATVEWSWDMLSAPERHVLARLSVFAGGLDLAAAEAIAGSGAVRSGEVAGYLGALVDKSLVQFDDAGAGQARYRLLETVRQFASDKLEQEGPDVVHRARFAQRDYYLALAEKAAPRLISSDQAQWLDRLELELDNLRAAIACSLEDADIDPGIRLVTALRMFFKARGNAGEGIDALRALVDKDPADELAVSRARALVAEAYLLEQLGGYQAAELSTAEALAIARAARDDYLVADVLDVRGFVLLRRGQAAAALELIEAGLEIARSLDDLHLSARLLSGRSFAFDVLGDHAAAARDSTESVLIYRRLGDRRQVGTMLGNLGYCELSTGELESARSHLEESLEIARSLNDRYGVVYETFNLGLAACLSRSPREAERLFGESLELAWRIGMKASVAYALIGVAIAGEEAAKELRARLHGAADEALMALGETLEPLEAALRDVARERLRAALGTDAYNSEYAAGRLMGLAGAVDMALRSLF